MDEGLDLPAIYSPLKADEAGGDSDEVFVLYLSFSL